MDFNSEGRCELNWPEALSAIQSGKKVRAINWLTYQYCELHERYKFIIDEPEGSILKRCMPFDAITGNPGAGYELVISTGDTIGEWELYEPTR